MSYILDALKKSEQERSRGAIPDIKTVHKPRQVEYHKPSRWPYILLVVLLISAGGLGFWIYQQNMLPETYFSAGEGREDLVAMTDIPSIDNQQSNQRVEGSTPSLSLKQLEQNVNAIQSPSVNPVAPITQEKLEKPAKSETDSTPKEKSSAKKPNVIYSDEPLTVSESELKNADSIEDLAVLSDVQITPDAHSTISDLSEPVDDKVYDIAELPESVKRVLPAISFAGHVYSSTQSQRSVMLNGKKMREGQEVTKGLVLEEITIEGVVLRSQGYRFKLGALQDWSFQ